MVRQNQHLGLNAERAENIPKSQFDLSHRRLQSFKMGELVPILCQPVNPNETWSVDTTILGRLAPLVAPVFGGVKLFTRYYFIPSRIIWSDFKNFITAGEDGADTSVYPYITVGATECDDGTLGDYLGLPDGMNGETISAEPFRAYRKIYNFYYRNENIQTAQVIDLTDGEDTTTPMTLLNVNWNDDDYFVGCLPWPQRSSSETYLTFDASSQPVVDYFAYGDCGSAPFYFRAADDDGVQTSETALGSNGGGLLDGAIHSGNLAFLDPNDRLYVDLSAEELVSIRELRQSVAYQVIKEILAIVGSRYQKYCKAFFGGNYTEVDEPLLLGGNQTEFLISEVLQTSETNTTAQGTMTGHGIAPHAGHGFRYTFQEHGWIMGLAFVMPSETVYQEGYSRWWERSDRWDFPLYYTSLIGDQAVYTYELQHDHSSPSSVFGYNRRFKEYMSVPSSVHGDFKSESANTLDTWHQARHFNGVDQSLDSTFITADPDTRIFANETVDHIFCDIKHKIFALRSIAKEDTPYKLV